MTSPPARTPDGTNSLLDSFDQGRVTDPIPGNGHDPHTGLGNGRFARRAGSAEVPRVSVVIPTLNEAQNLPHVFAALPPELFEVIVVDGRSTDDTIKVAQQLRSDVQIVLDERIGKGFALARGFAAARGDIIVTLDGDGSMDPREIPAFVEALLDGAHFAKGSRLPSRVRAATTTRRSAIWATAASPDW